MSVDNKFGPVITAGHVRKALTDTIQLWIGDYLAEVSSIAGRNRDALKPFRSYVPMLNVRKFVEDQVPACIIISPGTMAVKGRARAVDARWAAGIGSVVSGRDQEETLELAELYAAAVRSIVVQHPSLGGFAVGTNLVSERYDELDSQDSRTLGAGIIQVSVDVDGIVDPSRGPTTPSDDATVDPGAWPTVQRVGTELTAIGSEQ